MLQNEENSKSSAENMVKTVCDKTLSGCNDCLKQVEFDRVVTFCRIVLWSNLPLAKRSCKTRHGMRKLNLKSVVIDANAYRGEQ